MYDHDHNIAAALAALILLLCMLAFILSLGD
jgi:hypothetical protein